MSATGSCHCGAVRFALDAVPTQAMTCNCSICRRKGYVLGFCAPAQFDLQTPRDAMSVYTFNRHVIRHQFCKTCGCAAFGEGAGPDGRPMVAVNLRCVDGVDLAAIATQEFDGAAI